MQTLKNKTDQELVKDYQLGNETAFELLVRRHKSKVYSYILFNVKEADLALDIFQDTFFKVVNTLKKGQYNEEGKFLPWVYRIAHNLIMDHFRKNKRMPMHSNNNEDDYDVFNFIACDTPNVEEKMLKKQILQDVKKMIQFLPDDQKEVLILRLYYHLSFKEIADKTNVSINTALGRMRYALINLRKMMVEKNLTLSVT
jgi:RNA polymerase sigma-70 factor (ECF subfamily)